MGAGGMGSFHANTLASLPGVEIVIVADPVLESAQRVAASVGAHATVHPDEVASSSDLDGLVIASPEQTHEALILAAIARGTRILCEKPLAVTSESCRRIVDAESARGHRLLQLGLMRVYDPAHVLLAAELPGLGAVHHIRCVHRNVNDPRRTASNVLNSSIVHDIHTLRWLAPGEIRRVTALTTPSQDEVSHLLVVAEFAGGGYGTIEFAEHSYAYEVSVEVEAERGGVMTAPRMSSTLRRAGHVSVEVGTDWFGRFAEAYRLEVAAWVRSMEDAAASGPSAWDGYVAQLVVEAAVESLVTGQSVAVNAPGVPAFFASQ